MPRSARALTEEVKAICKNADEVGRDLLPAERDKVEGLLDAAEVQAKAEAQYKAITSQFGPPNVTLTGETPGFGGDSPGATFVSSPEYVRIKNAGSRGQTWTTGPVAVGYLSKGTLLEGSGSPGSGTGGGLVPTPQVAPGIVDKLVQPVTLESLLLGGQATGNPVRYAVEGTATSGAAGVAEGGTKPESTLAFSTKDEPIKKIATSLSISDELIEDAPAVQTFVNGQLSSFVQSEAERQLFRGTQGGNEVQGILTSRNVPVYAGGTAAGTKAEQLFKALNGTRGSAFVEPEWIVLHPSDWQDVRLLKDTANQYLGGGPFLGAYGNGGQVSSSGQLTGAVDTLWGKPVYVTSNIGNAGTALIGSRAAAQVWSRGGLTVEASNSHDSYFVENLIAIRAERRLGLTLYRPDAFVEVRLA
jgi:HK97 family phage major capsid protein